tara:strand:+ start:70240 stop:70806 length:567 start_codon:yes stop_codon:yes gene_type:complete
MNLKFLASITVSLLLAVPARALPEDARQELVIRSQQAEMDRKTGIVIYQGNVILTQGTLKITADKLRILHEGNLLKRAVAEGAPARYQQRITADKPITHAEGSRIEYLSEQDEVIVSGNAILKQGGDQFNGERLTYDMSAETVKADGGATSTAGGENQNDDARIRMIIQPQKEAATANPGSNADGNSQ